MYFGRWLFVCLCASFLFGDTNRAKAQTIPPAASAGQVPQRFEAAPQPKSLPPSTAILLPSTQAPSDAARLSLRVRRVEVVGSTIYASFDDLTSPLVGHKVQLAEVYALAAKITARYGQDGYVLSRAIVPPQSLDPAGAVVRLTIVEGYVDEVVWPDGLRDRYRDFFGDYAASITSSRPANIKVIERALLLASDLPGLTFGSTFQASRHHQAAATLVVTVTEKRIGGEVTVDNRGARGRGPWEAQASGTLNNALGQHEAISVKYATALPNPDQLQYGELSYRQVLGSNGLTFGLTGSYNTGLPGIGLLQAINYDSNAWLFNASLAYPIIRTRDRNLTVSGIAFTEDVKSRALGQPLSDDRLRGLRGKVDFDTADAFGGTTLAQAIFSQGIDGLGSTGNGNPLSSRSGGRVDFTKLEVTVSRTQRLDKWVTGLSVYGSIYGQYAWESLLTAEQCSYGGRIFGRAFDPSALVGDNCITSLFELRYDLAIPNSVFSRSQVYAFADHGYVDRVTTSAGLPKDQWASSAGAGLRLGWRENVFVTLEAARTLAGDIDEAWRGHLEVTGRY